MKSREIAEWMGLSYNTYKSNIKKYLPELDYYCNYEICYGGIEVKEIFISDYVRNLASKDSEAYLNLVRESNNGLCTISGMGRKLALLYPDTWGKRSQSNVEYRLRKAGISLFGKTNLPIYRQQDQEERYSGPYGYKEYCWAIKIDNLNKYRHLTEDELEKFKILIESYGVTKEDIALKEQYDKKKLQELKEDKITKEEYILAMEHNELFPELLSRFKELTGCTLVKATQHDIIESAF